MAATSRQPGAFPILRRAGIAAVATILVWTGRAEAQPVASIELHWAAPTKCPGADDVQARVRRLVGNDVTEEPPKERLVADGTVIAANGHYRLVLTVRQPSAPAGETRVWESTSCESLAGAAAVTLALLARGEARSDSTPPHASPGPPASSSPSPSVAPVPASTPAPAPAPASAPAPAPAPASAPSPTEPSSTDTAHDATSPAIPTGPFALQAPMLVVDGGVLPSPAYGLGVGAEVRVSRVLLMLAGVLWLPQSEVVAANIARYQRRSAELSGCYAWPLRRFEAGPCLTMALEDVTADGSGADVVGQQGHVSWLTLGVGVQTAWSFRRWAALFLRPSLRLTTSRPTFTIEGVGPLHQVPFAAAGAEMGCEWIF